MLSPVPDRPDAPFNVVASMGDEELVCQCNEVTMGTITANIRQKDLKTLEEVADATRASTGCGSCAQLVVDILQLCHSKKTEPGAQSPSPHDSILPVRIPMTEYPSAYPRNLEVERIKQEGLDLNFEAIREMGAMALTADDYYRLKTFGVCSQKHPGYFMVRIRIPAGRLTATQLFALAELSETHGRGRAHLTTRQDLELHWVRLEEISDVWTRLDEIGLSTRSACGHTVRNVMACPHSAISPDSPFDVRPWAALLSDHLVSLSAQINPTMPNRLNLYFAGCGECAPHAAINDIGFVATRRPEGADAREKAGFALWVGGSLGTHPIPGFELKPFMEPGDALAATQAILEIHARHGTRKKARSRLKWLIESWGREKFASVFERLYQCKRTLPETLAAAKQVGRQPRSTPSSVGRLRATLGTGNGAEHLPPGWRPQKQADFAWTVVDVPLGEIGAEQLRTLARISRRYGNAELHLNAEQNAEIHWVPAPLARKVSRALAQAGLRPKGQLPSARLVACPGTEFCVLAVTNAQGAAREILRRYTPKDPRRAELFSRLSIHISGCPNSCAKHQIADVGLAGTMTTIGDQTRYSYLLYLGGRSYPDIGLGQIVRKGITEEMVIPTLDALLALAVEHRRDNESFCQVVNRMGHPALAKLLDERLARHLPTGPARPILVPETSEVNS